MLAPEHRVRFARHRSLVEIGDAGQAALLASSLGAPLRDARAEHVRRDYLLRAGISEREDEVALPPVASDVADFAGATYLEEAAASVLGAMHAVEHLKRALHVGAEAPLPPLLKLIEKP